MIHFKIIKLGKKINIKRKNALNNKSLKVMWIEDG